MKLSTMSSYEETGVIYLSNLVIFFKQNSRVWNKSSVTGNFTNIHETNSKIIEAQSHMGVWIHNTQCRVKRLHLQYHYAIRAVFLQFNGENSRKPSNCGRRIATQYGWCWRVVFISVKLSGLLGLNLDNQF